MYTAPLENVINAHSLGRMIYADDTQIYIVLDETERSSLIPNSMESYGLLPMI